MRLSEIQFKRLKELSARKDKLSEAEKVELAELLTLKRKKSDEDVKNDFSWHNKYPQLLEDAAVVSNNYVPGTQYYIDGATMPMLAGVRCEMMLTPGRCESASDGFNLQAKSQWVLLHRKYRGLGGYESADYGIVQFGILQVYALLFEAERIYGVINYYDARNRNLPQVYSHLTGCDLDNFRDNLADYRYRLNNLIKKIRLLAVVNGLSVFEDCDRLFSNVFSDRDSARKQILFYTCGFEAWKWDPTVFTTGSGLIRDTCPVEAGGAPRKYTTFLSWIESLMDALITDDDVQRIVSDVLAAYDDSEIMAINYVPEDYTVVPVYSEERALQFHNLTCIEFNSSGIDTMYTPSDVVSTHSVVIYQKDNVVKFVPTFFRTAGGYTVQTDKTVGQNDVKFLHNTVMNDSGSSQFCMKDELFDIWKDHATVEDITVGTRMKYVIQKRVRVDTSVTPTITSNQYELVGFGAYICTGLTTFAFNGSYLGNTLPTRTLCVITASAVVASRTVFDNIVAADIGIYTQFDTFPVLDMNYATYIGFVSYKYEGIFGPIDNLFVLPHEALIRISDTSILSLWKFKDSLLVGNQ